MSPGRASASAWPFAPAALALCGALVFGSLARTQELPSATSPPSAADARQGLPLAFIANRGQLAPRTRYYAHGPGFAFHFTDDRIAISLVKGGRGHALHLRFPGASEEARVVAGERRRGRVNYLGAGERHANIPTYGSLTYRDLWPGIDMVIRGAGGRLKYEFRLAPGADPGDIRLAYAGADGLSVTRTGTLAVATPLGVLTDTRPRSYQRAAGGRVSVRSSFARRGARSFGFALGPYSRSRPLVIDPALAYSTFLGGSGNEGGSSIAVDRAGSAYVVGEVATNDPIDFPTTPGAFQNSGFFQQSSFVTKLSPDGSDLVYSTVIQSATDADGVAIDDAGNAYVTGGTHRSDFPTTPGAFDHTLAGARDRFVLKLNPTGSALVYSTYLGGSGLETINLGHAGDKRVAVDSLGHAYVTAGTESADFPTTPGAHDRTLGGLEDAFVTKLNPDGSGLVYSTYLGGSGSESNAVIALDEGGRAHVAGETTSQDFPATAGAFDTTYGGGNWDGYVARLAADGSGLAWATYVGGSSGELGKGIAVDSDGYAYFTGSTSSRDFPTTPGVHDRTIEGSTDSFVTKVTPDGTALAWSTVVGGTGEDQAEGIAVNARREAHIAGVTYSLDHPTTPDAIDSTLVESGLSDAFFMKLNPTGSGLLYSTYLGDTGHERGFGVATAGGRAYVSGEVGSPAFPTTPGAFDRSFNGVLDAFVMRFDFGAGPPARLELTPKSASNAIGTEHCVTARVSDEVGDPTPGEVVRFDVSGSVETSRVVTTGAGGEAVTCYAGPELPGADEITAFADANSDGDRDAGEPTDGAAKTWVAPASTAGCRATANGRIIAANGDAATLQGRFITHDQGAPAGRGAYFDRGPVVTVRMRTTAIDALVCDRHTATALGRALVDGDEVGFRIDLEDNGTGRRDSYRLLLATGYDSGSQRLTGGQVKVR